MQDSSRDIRLFQDVTPGTIFCIGRNYAAHAAELRNPVPAEPVVFLKATHAVRAPDDRDRLAFADETFHHEVELVVLIGREVPRGATAGWDAVRAIALGIDLTRRGVQEELKAKGLPWAVAKSFQGSAIVTPGVPLAACHQLDHLRFELEVNGVIRQRGDTADMLFPIPRLLTYLATLGPLTAGDLVFSGTPAGVGELRRGDRFTLRLLAPERAWEGIL